MNQLADWKERASQMEGLDARRLSALLGGGALAVYGLSRRSPLGLAIAAAGGALAVVGAGSSRRSRPEAAFSTVLLNCAPEEAYRFWRNFGNLPLFMRHLDSVQDLGNDRSRWTAVGPLGKQVSWEAEITTERENELIAWRSIEGSDISINGNVGFKKAPADRGTILTAEINFAPPAGQVGKALAKALGKDPKFLMTQDLRRMKALIEAGEIPTTQGQPHGRRSMIGRAAKALDPDMPARREPRIGEVLTGVRSAS